MTTDPRTLVRADELVPVLRELVDVGITLRPYLAASRDHFGALLLDAPPADVLEALDRLDGALADAGEVLAAVER